MKSIVERYRSAAATRSGLGFRRAHGAGTVAAAGDLAGDTAVEGSDGRYRADLAEDRRIWGPMGGDVASVAWRAAAAEALAAAGLRVQARVVREPELDHEQGPQAFVFARSE